MAYDIGRVAKAQVLLKRGLSGSQRSNAVARNDRDLPKCTTKANGRDGWDSEPSTCRRSGARPVGAARYVRPESREQTLLGRICDQRIKIFNDMQ